MCWNHKSCTLVCSTPGKQSLHSIHQHAICRWERSARKGQNGCLQIFPSYVRRITQWPGNPWLLVNIYFLSKSIYFLATQHWVCAAVWLGNIISDLSDMLATNWPLNALHFYELYITKIRGWCKSVLIHLWLYASSKLHCKHYSNLVLHKAGIYYKETLSYKHAHTCVHDTYLTHAAT